ncbi:MAG TPA: glycosyltransferase family 4 protein, partial [Longimicrobiales bacterium]|nr:glycosyltransferase family 4 protein [Longimicrobiales bacterium]
NTAYTRLVYGRIPQHHVANSEATRRTLLESAPWLSHDRVSVIPNGVDVAAIAAARPAQLPVPASALVVGFFGRLEPRKGILDLLAAWPDVAAAVPAAYLVVVGRGPLEDEVNRRSIELPRVYFLGYRADVENVLQRCAVLAMPSHWEGFGLVAAEALAAGKAVVATNVSSLPEIVRPDRDGLLVPPRDPVALSSAIIRLCHDESLRKQLGESGAARVRERFTQERMVGDYERLLQRFAKS